MGDNWFDIALLISLLAILAIPAWRIWKKIRRETRGIHYHWRDWQKIEEKEQRRRGQTPDD